MRKRQLVCFTLASEETAALARQAEARQMSRSALVGQLILDAEEHGMTRTYGTQEEERLR